MTKLELCETGTCTNDVMYAEEPGMTISFVD